MKLFALLCLGGFFFSLNAFTKTGLEYVDPIVFLLLRFVVATWFLLPVLLKMRNIPFHALLKAFWVSLFLLLNVVGYVYGVNYTTVSSAQTLYSLTPCLAAVFWRLIYRSRITPVQIGWTILGLVWVLCIIFQPLIFGWDLSVWSLLGNGLVFCAVLGTTFFVVLSKPLYQRFTPLNLTAFSFAVVLLCTTPIALIQWDLSLISTMPVQWRISILVVALLWTIAGYFVYQYIVKISSAFQSSIVGYIAVVFATLIGYFFYGDDITWMFVVGALLALWWAWLVSIGKEK